MYKLLLVVDDVLERRFLYKRLQKHLGNQFEIYEAADEKEAIELFEREKMQFAIVLKSEQVIVVRAVDYLLKPYEENELIDVIKAAVRGQVVGNVRKLPDCAQSNQKTEKSRISRVKRRMEQYVAQHYMEEISMYDAAEQMNYSEAYFCKLFKQCFGTNFTSYLAKYRVEEAKKLLRDSGMNAKEVGKACGYSDPCYFTRVFRRETGCTPLEYRNKYINDELE